MRRSSLLRLFLFSIVFVPVLAASTSQSQEAKHDYSGTKNCRKCHIKEWKSWSDTKMAKAYESLKPGVAAEKKKEASLDPDKDYTTDADCLRCHTTGYGQPGGFVDLETTPELVGVGCEMCHGPGGTYTQDQYMSLKNKEFKKADVVAVGLVDQVSEKQCTVCHNSDSPFVGDDYVFDFASMKDKGVHEHFPLKYSH